MIELKVFRNYQKVPLEFVNFTGFADWINNHSTGWRLLIKTPAELVKLAKIKNQKFVCKAIKEAIEDNVDLLEIWQSNQYGVRRIALKPEIDLKTLTQQFCQAYCQTYGYRMMVYSLSRSIRSSNARVSSIAPQSFSSGYVNTNLAYNLQSYRK